MQASDLIAVGGNPSSNNPDPCRVTEEGEKFVDPNRFLVTSAKVICKLANRLIPGMHDG